MCALSSVIARGIAALAMTERAVVAMTVKDAPRCPGRKDTRK
jgi:hypothetical protein